MSDEPKRRMLKMEPIAGDDNALEQLCAAVARIEDGIGGLLELLITVTPASSTPHQRKQDSELRAAIDRLTQVISAAVFAGSQRVTLTLEEAVYGLECFEELRRLR